MTTSNLYIRTKQVCGVWVWQEKGGCVVCGGSRGGCVGAAGKGGGVKVRTTLELSSKNLAAMTLLECPVKML